MKQKILATLTTLAAALVCSAALSLTAFAEEYPVIQSENGTALNGVYEENGRYVAYIDGKPVNGPYTYMKDGFLIPGHAESYTDKNGEAVEAARWMYAENGSFNTVTGWYGPEEYRRFYYYGELFCGSLSAGTDKTLYEKLKDTPDGGKYFDKGLWFTGFYSHGKNGIIYFKDGEAYYGNHQVTEEDQWMNGATEETIAYWNLEVGKTYLFSINDRGYSTLQEGFYEENGCKYWYEKGLRQGTAGRGKEIYDPASDAWYWLDAVDNGKVATSKDVYQESYAGAYADRPDGTGKWVRYDAEGHMIKGWSDTEAGTYYFDPETGAMAKGTATIDGTEYTFDKNTGLLTSEIQHDCVWVSVDGKDYWYENGVRQGYAPENPDYRGKEIYDPASDAWYWLDNIQQGAKAVSKDVYQESWAGQWADREDGTGKWVRYDENGHMVKGLQGRYEAKDIPNTYTYVIYYFDLETGAMAKGKVSIIDMSSYDGIVYETVWLFDEVDGRGESISRKPYTGDREVGSAIRLE